MNYHISNPSFKAKVRKAHNSITFFYPGINEIESSPYLVILPRGIYTFECWGASGVGNGYGGYTSGEISLTEATSFYLYLGASIKTDRNNILYNGGGSGDSPGGGATDVRLTNGNWSSFQSLKSRIMVAGGGGGADYGGNGGYGGGITGGQASSFQEQGNGGTQTAGGIGYVNGGFGIGGSSVRFNSTGHRLDNGGGGGSGYYGGSTGMVHGCCGGGGGSSFISGFHECDAINESSTKDNIIHTGQSIHYSGYVFYNPKMFPGNTTMPLPTGSEGLGYIGSGVVRISASFPIHQRHSCTTKKSRMSCITLIMILLLNYHY